MIYAGDVQRRMKNLVDYCIKLGMNQQQTELACYRLSRKIARQYGLLNKYDGKGGPRIQIVETEKGA